MDNHNKNIIVGDDGSYFDGGFWAYIGHIILVNFVTTITFGIAYPWMQCWHQKWLCEHTVISGKRMTFNGKGGDLFVKYILWLLLCYLTCGIYAFWMSVAIKKWMVEHTNFEGQPDNNSFFDGGVGEYFGTVILSYLALYVPFVGPAWSQIILTRWFVGHTVIDSRRLTFRGTVGDLFVKYLIWGLLTTVTCGIFALFVPLKYIKWETENTYDENCTPEALNERANYITQIHTDAVILNTGDAAQLQTIKLEMLNDAQTGIDTNDLQKINNALRFADILKECGQEFSLEENEILYNCEILARRLKSTRPKSKKSKTWLIIVAAVVAVSLLLGVVGAAIAAIFMITPAAGLRNPIMSIGGMASVEVPNNYQISYSDFQDILNNAGNELGHVASKTMTYDEYDNNFKENYMVNCKSSGLGVTYFITVSVKDDEVDYIEVSGLRDEINTLPKMTQMVRYLYKEIGLGDESEIIANTDSGYHSETYYNWTFEYENTEETFIAKIDNIYN